MTRKFGELHGLTREYVAQRYRESAGDGVRTIPDLVIARADADADFGVFDVLDRGDDLAARSVLTAGRLAERARAIAARLAVGDLTGHAVLLLYQPGLDYLTAFFGCLFAGVPAVPVYPPSGRLTSAIPRLARVVRDANAKAILTTTDLGPTLDAAVELAPELGALPVVRTDTVADTMAADYRRPAIGPDTLAFLQYTSGSTADPKGVRLTHGNLLHNCAMICAGFGLTPGKRAVIWLPPYHDMGLIGGILAPLHGGASATLMSPITMLERPIRWLRAISELGGTHSGGPNFAFDLCVDRTTESDRAELDLSGWEVAFNGSDTVRADTLERFSDAFADAGFRPAAFRPCYGLAEATLMVTCANPGEPLVTRPSDAGRPLVGCGTVAGDQELLIVDPANRVVTEPGEPGEICVSGPSVADGYWNRPEETAATFVPHPNRPDSRMLRTGDVGELDEQGRLYVRGRIKDLLIIRGRNFYPQDIELTVEQSHARLRAGYSAALSVESDGAERLVVVAAARGAGPREYEQIGDAIRAEVMAEHGVAVHAVSLVRSGAVPKTSSGKVQRHAVRAQFLDGTLPAYWSWTFGENTAGTPDRPADDSLSPRERLIRDLVEQVAAHTGTAADRIGLDEPMRSLGLDSVGATMVCHAMEQAHGVSIPLTALLGDAGIREVADLATPVGAAPDPADDPPGEIALSAGQTALWFLHRMAPHSAAYHVPCAIRIRSTVDTEALRTAFGHVLHRHEALRWAVHGPNDAPRATPVPAYDVLRVADADVPEEELRRLVDEEVRRPFDLANGRLIRAVLHRGRRDAVLVVTAHHVAVDLWSLVIILREVVAAYERIAAGERLPRSDVDTAYRDFAAWQRDFLSSAAAQTAIAHFTEALAGAPPFLTLPPDATPPATPRMRGRAHRFDVPRPVLDGLGAIAREAGTTLYPMLVAAWATVLARHAGQAEVVVGMPSLGRPKAEFGDAVGYFVNMVPVRVVVGEQASFLALLDDVRAAVLAALEHQHLPFSRLVEALAPERAPGRPPLLQTMVALERPQEAQADISELILGHHEESLVRLGSLDAGPYPVDSPGAQLDLSLTVVQTGDGLSCAVEYDSDVHHAGTVTWLAGHFTALLSSVTAAPTGIPRLLDMHADGERDALAEWARGPRLDVDPGSLVDAFERVVDESPTTAAVSGGGVTLTYRELDAAANRVANRLLDAGAGPDAPVGLAVGRSVSGIAAMLGILKAGAGYLPLDREHPADWLAGIVTGSGARVVLADADLGERLRAATGVSCLDPAGLGGGEHRPRSAIRPSDTAYVIYTSGSTGKPKGVPIPHSAARAFLAGAAATYGFGPGDRVLQFASWSFDTSVEEIFGALLRGATLVLRDEEMLGSVPAFLRRCADERITALDLPTAFWHELVRAAADLEPPETLRLVIVGGEGMRTDALAGWFRTPFANIPLVNTYGPTETTVCVVARELRPADASAAVVPIGTPLPNVRVSVVDAEGVPCPVGAVGELLVGGPTLADGYLGLPDATAAAFPADLPWSEPGTRWYRTGDRARWRADGALECLGRIDSQVKLRGFRIEPEEIESALRALPGVADAAACVVGEAARARLTGFVVADGAVEPAALLAGLAERLPAHLVPAGVVVLPGLPHTVSGKVDRRALAALAAGTDAGGRAPRNAAEALMAEIWQRALGLDRVAVDANFFELGGHSLAAMQVLSLLHTRTGVELGVRALFEAPTIAELVELAGLGAADESTLDQEAGAELRRDPGLPLSFGQERIWQMDQRQPGATFFNCVTTLRLRGELDPGALRFAFDRLVERHEALRTTIETRDGRPVQRIWDPLAVPIDVRDVSAMDAEGRAAAVRAAVAAETTTPISLYDKPFARARLLRLAAAEHVLVVTFHHAAIDDWTDRVLATEFAALYRAGCEGVAPDLPETTVQYADFASWQRRTLSGDALRDGVEGWRKALAGVAFDSDPPADREPPEPPTHRAAIVRDQLSERTTELLRADWARRRVTSYMATLAAYQVLLAAESGSRDVCVESPMANRTDWRIERMVGYLVNPVLLRLDLRGDPRWSRILELARESCLHAFAHQHVPFAEVVHMLSDTRDLFRFPVAKFILVSETGGLGRDLPGLDVEVLESAAAPQSKNRYLMTVVERRRALGVEILFNTDQIDMPHARRAAAAYRVLLDRVATDDPPLSELIELVRFSLGDTNS